MGRPKGIVSTDRSGGYGIQGIEIPFLLHESVEIPHFFQSAVFHGQDTIIAAQLGGVQGVSDHNTGQAVQIQDGIGHMVGGFFVQGCGGLMFIYTNP